MKRYWDLRVRFLIVADDDTLAWVKLYRKLPETDEELIQYDSMSPAEEWIPDWHSQSSCQKVNER